MKIENMDHPQEECAVFGVSMNQGADAAGIVCNALLSMQHRGQEGCGIAAYPGEGRIVCRKNVGLVSEVFTKELLEEFPPARAAIGHNRYSTTGCNTLQNVQPFVTEYLTGRMAAAHNGNLVNALSLRQELAHSGICFDATSDSEVLSRLIVYHTLARGNIRQGVIEAGKRLKGAFSVVLLCSDGRLIALRDPDGFRPLCIGQNERGIAVASESCALESCGFSFVRDILPGELVEIFDGKIIGSEVALTEKTEGCGLCIFEYVYFSRTDSIIDGLSVYKARFEMGRQLAREHPVDADVVCGVPDSGLEAAAGFAAESGLPFVTGFVKNRYIGRSFIYPSQEQRENAVRMKLNPLRENVQGKRVVLVDDSIVRGTTSEQIVRLLRQAGAKEVHFRVSSPPFLHTCLYGTDIDREENLIANRLSLNGICKRIGADSLGYISVHGLKEVCSPSKRRFCTRCFTGYPEETVQRKEDLE